MSAFVNNVKVLFKKYPIIRGMASYTIIWPTGNIIHQTIDGKRWGEYSCARD
jgi:protein Mpv17